MHEFSALVFSKTAGYRHASIPDGIAAIRELGEKHGFAVEAAEDGRVFTPQRLARYAVVVWLSTSGDMLDREQQAAFEDYIARGGGYAGVHAAAATEYSWPWYGGLVGAQLASHPEQQPATVVLEDTTHPSTWELPVRWQRFDEWYNYLSNPRDDVHVLASLDESSYAAGADAMGDHPIAWWHEYRGGYAWHTGMGHTSASYRDPSFLSHLLGGIQAAAGVPLPSRAGRD